MYVRGGEERHILRSVYSIENDDLPMVRISGQIDFNIHRLKLMLYS